MFETFLFQTKQSRDKLCNLAIIKEIPYYFYNTDFILKLLCFKDTPNLVIFITAINDKIFK